MSGLQNIPLRIPSRWDPAWFERFVREILAPADVRNALAGAGISIEGSPDTPATIAADADLEELATASVVTALPSNVPEARRLVGGEGIRLDDNGGGSTLVVTVSNVPFGRLQQIPAPSVVGASIDLGDGTSPPGVIPALEVDRVLGAVDDGSGNPALAFVELTLDMAPANLWTFGKLQQVEGPAVVGVAAEDVADLEAITAGTPGLVLATVDVGGGEPELGFVDVTTFLDLLGSAAEGDIIYRTASGWALLPRGNNGQVLTLDNGVPTWQDP